MNSISINSQSVEKRSKAAAITSAGSNGLYQFKDKRLETIQQKSTLQKLNKPSGPVIQKEDSDWEPESNDAPVGYMDPSVYYDEYGGSDHSDLDGTVWVKKVSGHPALWWQNPAEENDLRLTGARHSDVSALGGDDTGYTWHHCADYSGGTCTMQQVDTDEHASWGHIGGASQAGYS
ncbi:MAG: HNH endonuclease [Lentisphaeraceae bacterium]|nr:HNH endonuclease [Lentisphaeraceae bacterium]